MDKMGSKFSIQQDHCLLETESFSITYSDRKTPQAPRIFDHASFISLQGQGTTLNSDKKGKSKLRSSYVKCPKDGLRKRIARRDVERLRRQEMANLCESLRSFIPEEHLKGKRSISDHVHGASNYIRDLQNDIEELKNKRNGLKNDQENFKTRNCSKTIPINVTVKTCTVGVEVSITGNFSMEGFPLSSLLQMLGEEGLNVISCIYTRVEGNTSHYTIQSEVMDFPGVNIDMLKRKLCHTVNHWINLGVSFEKSCF